ncbi:MAG: BMP family ABC transporter substrate-binding protein [Christensenellales bacterium]
MKKLLAIVLAAVMAFGVFAFTGCSDKTGKSDFKVGAILIGDENEGYTYAHIQGIEAAKKACNLSDDQIIYKYNVTEDEKCYEAAVDLAEQGCKLIIANSFGHEDHLIRAAKEYPDVVFCHATGQKAAKHTELNNIFNYFDSIYEARYVSGIVAGMKLKALMDEGKVTDPYVGYVGAYPYAEVVSGYTAFFLGIRSIVPEAHMDVQYTKEWFDIVKEREAANALMSRGCVIIGQHADSTGAPSAVQAKYEAGETVFSVGYNIDMLSVAPDVALTSPQNNWGAYYTYAFEQVMKGKKPEQDWCRGYSDNAVQLSPLGKACAAGTQEAVDAAIEKIKSGELKVFDCSTFTVNGEHLTSYDKSHGFEGTKLIWDGYFHESEVISAPLFDIRIDGITELSK